MATLKEYLTENQGDDFEEYRLIDQIMPMDKWYKDILSVQGQASFANPNLTRPIANKPRGYITLKEFFDPKNTGDFDGQAQSYVTNIKDLLTEYGNWEIKDEACDNTYNWKAPIEDYIDFIRLHLVDPESHSYDAIDLLLMRCGVNLDPRGNYTNFCGAIFDCSISSDDHYNSAMYFGRIFNVANADITVFNTKTNKYEYWYLSVDASANSDTMTIDLMPVDDLYSVFDSEPIEVLSEADYDDLHDVLTENCNLAPENRLSIRNLEYCCESIN